MTRRLYQTAINSLVGGTLDLDTADIRAQLVSSGYVFSAAHTSMTDVAGGNRIGAGVATTRTSEAYTVASTQYAITGTTTHTITVAAGHGIRVGDLITFDTATAAGDFLTPRRVSSVTATTVVTTGTGFVNAGPIVEAGTITVQGRRLAMTQFTVPSVASGSTVAGVVFYVEGASDAARSLVAFVNEDATGFGDTPGAALSLATNGNNINVTLPAVAGWLSIADVGTI